MNKRFALIIAACVLVFAVFLVLAKKEAKAPTSNSAQLTNHTAGEGKSGVVLIEYGDFQCSACYKFEPIIRQVKEKYKEQLTFQFRHFPLFEIHKNALVSSRAAEAAALQGKFWEMHDLLYENQDPNGRTGWVAATDPTSYFVGFATEIGLDIERFKTDLKGSQTNDPVQADRAEAKRLKFSGTPSFVLDGKPLDNPQADLEWFSSRIDEAIAAKQQ